MKSEVPEAQPNKDAHGEGKANEPSAQWKKVFRGAWEDVSARHLPNLLTLIVGILIGPAIGAIMRDPRAIIFGCALAVTILVWFAAYHLIKRVPAKLDEGSPPALRDTEHGEADTSTPQPAETALSQATPQRGSMTKDKSQTTKIDKSPGSIGNIKVKAENVTINQGVTPTPTPPTQPGAMTTENAAKMIEVLSAARGSKILLSSGSNPHTLMFRNWLENTVFKSAGWSVETMTTGFDASAEHGFIIGVDDPAHIPPAADKVIMALKRIGINASVDNKLWAAHAPGSFVVNFNITLYIGLTP